MESVILNEVQEAGIADIESAYGSLEEYLDAEWDIPVSRTAALAAWLYDHLSGVQPC